MSGPACHDPGGKVRLALPPSPRQPTLVVLCSPHRHACALAGNGAARLVTPGSQRRAHSHHQMHRRRAARAPATPRALALTRTLRSLSLYLFCAPSCQQLPSTAASSTSSTHLLGDPAQRGTLARSSNAGGAADHPPPHCTGCSSGRSRGRARGDRRRRRSGVRPPLAAAPCRAPPRAAGTPASTC